MVIILTTYSKDLTAVITKLHFNYSTVIITTCIGQCALNTLINPFSAGIDFRCQNLTSKVDPCTERVKR